MDKNKLKRICQDAINLRYSGITINSVRILPVSEYSVENGWTETVGTLVLELCQKTTTGDKWVLERPLISDKQSQSIEVFLEQLLGFDVMTE
jgi:hypothetical protein